MELAPNIRITSDMRKVLIKCQSLFPLMGVKQGRMFLSDTLSQVLQNPHSDVLRWGLFLWFGIQRIEEDDLSGLQTRHDGLLWRCLQSQAQAVHSAAGLPVWHGSKLVPGRYPDQDPNIKQKEVKPPSGRTYPGRQGPYYPALSI